MEWLACPRGHPDDVAQCSQGVGKCWFCSRAGESATCTNSTFDTQELRDQSEKHHIPPVLVDRKQSFKRAVSAGMSVHTRPNAQRVKEVLILRVGWASPLPAL